MRTPERSSACMAHALLTEQVGDVSMLLAAFYHPILATLFGFLAVLLMLVILLQRGRGVGLQGAFGGAGGHTAFGSKTGDILTWITVVGAGIFLFCVVILNYVFVQESTPGAAPAAGGGTGGAPAGGAPATPQGSWVVPADTEGDVFAQLTPFGENAC